jgi:hypothetical protein
MWSHLLIADRTHQLKSLGVRVECCSMASMHWGSVGLGGAAAVIGVVGPVQVAAQPQFQPVMPETQQPTGFGIQASLPIALSPGPVFSTGKAEG